jgi:hypothetical protein
MLEGRSRSSRLAAVVGAAIAALALAAPAATRPAVSKPQFIAQADALCGHAIRQLSGIRTSRATSTIATKGPQWIAIDTSTLAALRRLPQPASDASRIGAMLSGAAATVGELRASVAAARAGSASGLRQHATRFGLLAQRWHVAAAAYGLRVCSRW